MSCLLHKRDALRMSPPGRSVFFTWANPFTFLLQGFFFRPVPRYLFPIHTQKEMDRKVMSYAPLVFNVLISRPYEFAYQKKHTRIKPPDKVCLHFSFYKDPSFHRLTGLPESQAEKKNNCCFVSRKERSLPESPLGTCNCPRIALFFKKPVESHLPRYGFWNMIIFCESKSLVLHFQK